MSTYIYNIHNYITVYVVFSLSPCSLSPCLFLIAPRAFVPAAVSEDFEAPATARPSSGVMVDLW